MVDDGGKGRLLLCVWTARHHHNSRNPPRHHEFQSCNYESNAADSFHTFFLVVVDHHYDHHRSSVDWDCWLHGDLLFQDDDNGKSFRPHRELCMTKVITIPVAAVDA